MELRTKEDLACFLRAAMVNVGGRRPAAALPAWGGNPKRRPERFMAKDLMMIKELAAVSA